MEALKINTDLNQEDLNQFYSAINEMQIFAEFSGDGNLQSANANFTKSFGSADEIKGKKLSALMDEEYAESDEFKDIWNAFLKGESRHAEFKMQNKNKREVWISASLSPIRSE